MKAFVYFNLHRKCFSIKALEGVNKGRVVAHRNDYIIYNPTFKVSEAGRQRVIREKSKNVHAGVVGEWHSDDDRYAERTAELSTFIGRAVTYNPYKYDSFVYSPSMLPITDSPKAVTLSSNGNKASMFALS